MSVEELQKRIEELEQELAPLRTFKDCCVVQYYGKEHFKGELETLDIDRELTDEDFISMSNYIKNDDTMYNVIGERLTELIAEWCEENPQEEELKECSICLKKKPEDDIQYCPQCEESICVDCIDGDKCEKLEIDEETGETIFLCHSSCVEHYKVKNNCENDSEEEEMENKVYQVRRYIEIIFDENYNDEGDCELIEKKDFETREDAKKYYDTLNNIGKNLSYYNKIEGDDDYAVIEEIFENTLLSFNKISVVDLKCLCKLHEIKGYSKLKKQELLNILKTHSYFQGRFEEIVEEEEEKTENINYEEIYNRLQNEWINVWKEDNCYLVEETDNGSFSQSIAQSPFEEYHGSIPDYARNQDGYWAPTLKQFLRVVREEDEEYYSDDE